MRGCSCLATRDDSGADTRRANKRRNQNPQYPKAVSPTSQRNGFSSQDIRSHFDLAKAMDRSKTILALVWGLFEQMSNELTFLPQMCLEAFFGGRVRGPVEPKGVQRLNNLSLVSSARVCFLRVIQIGNNCSCFLPGADRPPMSIANNASTASLSPDRFKTRQLRRWSSCSIAVRAGAQPERVLTLNIVYRDSEEVPCKEYVRFTQTNSLIVEDNTQQ